MVYDDFVNDSQLEVPSSSPAGRDSILTSKTMLDLEKKNIIEVNIMRWSNYFHYSKYN